MMCGHLLSVEHLQDVPCSDSPSAPNNLSATMDTYRGSCLGTVSYNV